MSMIQHFFLSNEFSPVDVVNASDKFSFDCCFKSNETKCEISSIGVMKGVSRDTLWYKFY